MGPDGETLEEGGQGHIPLGDMCDLRGQLADPFLHIWWIFKYFALQRLRNGAIKSMARRWAGSRHFLLVFDSLLASVLALLHHVTASIDAVRVWMPIMIRVLPKPVAILHDSSRHSPSISETFPLRNFQNTPDNPVFALFSLDRLYLG